MGVLRVLKVCGRIVWRVCVCSRESHSSCRSGVGSRRGTSDPARPSFVRRIIRVGATAPCDDMPSGRPTRAPGWGGGWCHEPDGSRRRDHATDRRTRRRAHRRCRHLRHRQRLPPHPPVSREELPRARGARELRRHVAHAPLPGHPLRQRPLHLRLPLQAVDRAAHRHRRADPELPRRGDRGERPARPHPLRAPDHPCELVEPGPALDAGGHPRRHRRGAALHHQLPVDVPGLLPPRRGLHARLAGDGALRGSDRPPADLAGRPGLRRQVRHRHRVGRHGGHARSGHRRRLRPRDAAPALAHVLRHRPEQERDRRHVARAGGSRGVDPRDRAPQDPA